MADAAELTQDVETNDMHGCLSSEQNTDFTGLYDCSVPITNETNETLEQTNADEFTAIYGEDKEDKEEPFILGESERTQLMDNTSLVCSTFANVYHHIGICNCQ